MADIKSKFNKKIKTAVHHLQKFTDRAWYSYFIAALSLIDAFAIFIPTDGLLISSVILRPKRWVYLSLYTAIGSTIGALLLYHLIESNGLPWLLELYPGINKGDMWIWSETFFKNYGLFLVFFVAATPLFQQPAVILASLAHTPPLIMLALILSGRILKYMTLGYISSHSPKLLSKIWGFKEEIEEVGINLDSKNESFSQKKAA